MENVVELENTVGCDPTATWLWLASSTLVILRHSKIKSLHVAYAGNTPVGVAKTLLNIFREAELI
jgi:hypothetical protein